LPTISRGELQVGVGHYTVAVSANRIKKENPVGGYQMMQRRSSLSKSRKRSNLILASHSSIKEFGLSSRARRHALA
jgi:hypothetical protein